MKSKAIILLACMWTAQVFADDATKNPCVLPVQPNQQASEMVVKAFNKHLTVYTACIKKFVDDQRAISKNSTDPAKAQQANDAAEAAIVEYNALMENVKASSIKEE
jgi:hypothetical protein